MSYRGPKRPPFSSQPPGHEVFQVWAAGSFSVTPGETFFFEKRDTRKEGFPSAHEAGVPLPASCLNFRNVSQLVRNQVSRELPLPEALLEVPEKCHRGTADNCNLFLAM